MRLLLAALLLAACTPAKPTEQPSLGISVAKPDTHLTPAPPPPTEPPRNTWLADIRADEAFLHFGYPESDYIAFTAECETASGRIGVGMPSFGKPLITLSSGDATETYRAKINEGSEGYEDTVDTPRTISIDQPLWKNFRQTGQLAAAAPERDLTAPTQSERDEIENFFATCAKP